MLKIKKSRKRNLLFLLVVFFIIESCTDSTENENDWIILSSCPAVSCISLIIGEYSQKMDSENYDILLQSGTSSISGRCVFGNYTEITTNPNYELSVYDCSATELSLEFSVEQVSITLTAIDKSWGYTANILKKDIVTTPATECSGQCPDSRVAITLSPVSE